MEKIKTIICDIDGTISSSSWRDELYPDNILGWGAGIPFDKPLYTALNMIKYAETLGTPIIYLTGRKEIFRRNTLCWFHKYDVPQGLLIMRPEGNRLSNENFKKSVYENYLKSKVYILFAIDDNPKVIDMWKSLGIQTVFVKDWNLSPDLFKGMIGKT